MESDSSYGVSRIADDKWDNLWKRVHVCQEFLWFGLTANLEQESGGGKVSEKHSNDMDGNDDGFVSYEMKNFSQI